MEISREIGKKLLSDEINNDFLIIKNIRNPKIEAAIEWISSLEANTKNRLIVEVFERDSQSDLAKEYRSKALGEVGPRYAFRDRGKLLEYFIGRSDQFDFSRIDGETVVSICGVGKFKVITTIVASDRMCNIECRHSVKSDNPQQSGHFSLLRSMGIYHGDCWKSPDLLFDFAIQEVEIVLNEGYRRLSQALLGES